MSTLSKTDLPQIVKDEGFDLHSQGRSWGGNTCPSCGESSAHSNKLSVFVGRDNRWRFNCHACGAHGDGADFLALARNIRLSEALTLIDGGNYKPRSKRVRRTPVPAPLPAENVNEHLCEVLATLREKAFCDGPRSYLTGRNLTDSTIDAAIESGQLRMMPADPADCRRFLFETVGESLLKAAGLQKPDSAWPAPAFRPIIAIEPGGYGVEFRKIDDNDEHAKTIRYGVMQWPWFLKRIDNPGSILLVEGFIDLLSSWQIMPEADAIMGIPGVHGWRPSWFAKLKRQRPDATIMIGMDNDDAGNGIVDKIVSVLDTMKLQHVMSPPIKGHDWNDMLTYL